jgi:hypothetical protein
MMPRIAVVALDGNRPRLSNDMSFPRENLGERIPVVGVEDT